MINAQIQKNVRQLCYNLVTRRIQIGSFSNAALNEAEKLKTNPYYEKYSSRITEVLKNAPAKQSQDADKERVLPPKEHPVSSKPQLKPSSCRKPSKKTLDAVMRVDMIKDKTAEEIEEIWKKYHVQKDMIYGVLPEKTYEILHTRSIQHPVFVLPLPRNEGYEYFLCQFFGQEIHFTPLISYHTHKENAVECMNLMHYTELKDDKHIVLMHGEYVSEVLSSQEAMCLVNQLQLYYCGNDEKKLRLLERFTRYPQEFKHIDLIAELHTLSL